MDREAVERELRLEAELEQELEEGIPRNDYLNGSLFQASKKYRDSVDKALMKETNPKDAVGVKKAPMSTVSAPVILEIGLAMMEGARKYGRHNYRKSGVRGSVYYDATLRHLMDWWEGEDIDPDSGLSHVTKALASLTVLRDAMIQEMWEDDRPPKSMAGWQKSYHKKAAEIIEKYPESVEPVTEKNKNE